MKLRLEHTIRMYMLNRQANALMRRARRRIQPDEQAITDMPIEPIPDYSRTPGFWFCIGFAVAALVFVNVFGIDTPRYREPVKMSSK